MALIYQCDHGVTTLDYTSDWLFDNQQVEEMYPEYMSDPTEEPQDSWSGVAYDWFTPIPLI